MAIPTFARRAIEDMETSSARWLSKDARATARSLSRLRMESALRRGPGSAGTSFFDAIYVISIAEHRVEPRLPANTMSRLVS